MSLRQIANAAGVSPGTVRDVRARLAAGEDPVLASADRHTAASRKSRRTDRGLPQAALSERVGDVEPIARRLGRDPALTFKQCGRGFVGLLRSGVTLTRQESALIESIPSHLHPLALEGAYECAAAWLRFAEHLSSSFPGGAKFPAPRPPAAPHTPATRSWPTQST